MALALLSGAISFSASAQSKKVVVGGQAFGLKLICKGVMVTKVDSLIDGEMLSPAIKAGIKPKDIILEADGKKLQSNEDISKIIKNSDGKELNLKVMRNSKEIDLKIEPVKHNSEYVAGFWVKDSCAGLGTISYFDKETKEYGALGHGICENDSGGLMESDKGEVLKANITSVSKSNNNNIGTLNGFFTDSSIGNLSQNTPLGIFGSADYIPADKEYEVAEPDEVKTGKAKLLTTLSGSEPKAYNIEISKIENTRKDSNQNLIVKITDKELIEKTGGIVQGMSGSPILQNGKFVAVLTHVFVNDCKTGFAIFAKNMIES